MKTYRCSCGQTLFFDNNLCLQCHAQLGFCPECYGVVPLLRHSEGDWMCGNAGCGVRLGLCQNYVNYHVCNRCVVVPEVGLPDMYCDCCRYNHMIPDLSVAGNLQKWSRLEEAKRRLFYDLDLLRLPRGVGGERFPSPLLFDFKADDIPSAYVWRTAGHRERVYTGHLQGRITINIREADEVERERLRVDLGEAHRTLIGHFRHEMGHYYWEALIAGKHDAAFQSLFGNPWDPPYGQSLEQYYARGPVADWQLRYLSSYASMHAWEDWAETFAFYLDMVSALDTATHVGFLPAAASCFSGMGRMAAAYQHLGVGLNEMSRTLGLLDMVPEILSDVVRQKLEFIYSLWPPVVEQR